MPRRGFYSRGTTRVDEDTAMKVSSFNRGVVYISTQIAKLPWDVKDLSNKVVEDDISKLLSLAPNKEMNSFMFRVFLIQNAIIHGNSYAEIERNGVGKPISLWPIPTRDVELLRTTNGDLVYKVSNQGKDDVYLPPRDMFHIKNFHTKDGLIGQGLVAYAVETLGITLNADVMASGIFQNGGVPSGILKHPGKISDEAYKRLKDSWSDQTGGRKSGGTSILEEGVSYEPIKVEPEVLQFLESRQFGVLEIARFLGVPPTKLFDTTAATYSNVENANLEVATDTLDSWAVNLEMEADVKILNYRYGGKYTELDLYAVFRGDMKTRADYFKAMMGVGAMTPNQIRAREGQAPYPEGDKYYIATNNFTPVDRLDEVIDAQIEPKGSEPSGEEQPKEKKPSQIEDAVIKFLNK
jgi:HK97 family phage portal protein